MPHSQLKTASGDFVRKYLTGIFLVICLIVVSVFAGFYVKTEILIKEQLQQQGKAAFDAVRLHRQWAASHSGVFVRQKPGMSLNPYLKIVPGLKHTIRDQDGITYILKNPALITREVSELSGQEGVFSFRIVSLNPLNPANTPDAFERDALQRFEHGEKERFTSIQQGNDFLFHYMAPLVTDQSCLVCHGHQGYRVGDIRGGISVTINASTLNSQMHSNRTYLALCAIIIVVLVFCTIYYISSILIRALKHAEQQLIEMAVKDSLTGLFNRREMFRLIQDEISRGRRIGRALSLIMVDIDHFKLINDTHGHAAGDATLQYLTAMMHQVTRDYDIVCRYGGEEFIILTPETPLDQALMIAERLRSTTETTPMATHGVPVISITISVGVAQLAPDETPEQLIARADAALYRAKEQGRNRVVTAE